MKCYDLALSWLRDDLGLEYLWNGDEHGSLENSLKTMEKNSKYGGQPEILALVHDIERQITVYYEDSDKGTVFEESPRITSVQYCRGCSVLRGDSISTVGDSISTVGDSISTVEG